jgi:hypothetical protein
VPPINDCLSLTFLTWRQEYLHCGTAQDYQIRIMDLKNDPIGQVQAQSRLRHSLQQPLYGSLRK